MTVEELLAEMRLDVAVTWVCWGCKVQGYFVHPNIDAARHDAAGHAIGVHRDRLALTEIALKLVSAEEKEARTAALLGDLALVPPLDDIDNAPMLSDLQRDIVCDALGCDPDSRHRRKNPRNRAVS